MNLYDNHIIIQIWLVGRVGREGVCACFRFVRWGVGDILAGRRY